MKKNISILFIGNSHTYYNDLPVIVRSMFESVGISAQVVMQTEGGKDLLYHCDRRDVVLNIKQGGFDYVVLQEVASSFEREAFLRGAERFAEHLKESSSQPILYMIWAHEKKKHMQKDITPAYVEAGKLLGAPVAPAGELWFSMLRGNKSLPFYRPDGNHATPLGSYLAAACIFYAITGRQRPLSLSEGGEPHTSLGLEVELCKKIQSNACRITKKFNSK